MKKLAIADTLARTVVDPVFAVPGAYSGPDLWLAAYAYTAQIYCDFTGYTDMAIGLALLLGFVFPQNFRSPYRATGFSDFWRRWHMTLSPLPARLPLHPAGRQPQGPLEDLPQPDADDGARRAVARRGVDVRALGRASTGRACASSTRWRGRVKFPALAALVRDLPPRRLRVDPVPLDRASTRPASSSRACSQPGSATLFTLPVALMILVVIGLQLLPERGVERVQVRIERLQPVVLGAALAVVIALVAATVSSQGVAPFIYFRF